MEVERVHLEFTAGSATGEMARWRAPRDGEIREGYLAPKTTTSGSGGSKLQKFELLNKSNSDAVVLTYDTNVEGETTANTAAAMTDGTAANRKVDRGDILLVNQTVTGSPTSMNGDQMSIDFLFV